MAQGLNPLPRLKSWDSNRAQPVTVASLLPLIAALGTRTVRTPTASLRPVWPGGNGLRIPLTGKKALRCPLWIAYWVGLATYSATLRLFKVESGINGLLPTLGPLHLFRFSLEQASLRAGKVTAFCVR